jgi:hypothetical protein
VTNAISSSRTTTLPSGREGAGQGRVRAGEVGALAERLVRNYSTRSLRELQSVQQRRSKVFSDPAKTGAPARLGVIVASGSGYVREDGVAVIRIGTLAP